MTLDMALRFRDLLVADTADPLGGGEWDVLMTRTTDATVSLGARTTLANNWPADRFVSIHCNAFSNPAATGTETYAFADGTTAASMRDVIQEEMLDAWSLTDRGGLTAGFFVLVNTSMPASLSETGFITSPLDSQLIGNPVERQRMALAHLFALQRHYGLAPYEPGSAAPQAYCTAKTNSLGCVPFIAWYGNTPSLSGPDDFHVTGHAILGGQFGLFFYGFGDAAIPFGGGTLCIGPPFRRTSTQNAGAIACGGTFDFHFTQALMLQDGLAPGTTIFGQYLYRDAGFPAGNAIGMTNGLAFTLGL